MVNYVPILKAKAGELAALEHLDEAAVPVATPLLELPPAPDDQTKACSAFVERLRDSLPPGLAVGVDVSYLSEQERCPMQDIGDDMAGWGIPALPVLRLGDSDRRLASHGKVARTHERGAILRLGGTDHDPDPTQASQELPRIWKRTGLDPAECQLLLDMGELRDERDVGRAALAVRQAFDWAASWPWHSIAVAAGAMPESLSNFPTDAATEAPRWDAMLWQQLNQDHAVDYGDYAIAHPRMPNNVPRGPYPSLRYTAHDRWWIYRSKPDETGGYGVFYEICRALVASDHWPAQGGDFSWGDSELASRAGGIGGPGNATNWRAWGTSHHLAHVIRHLASSGVP